MPNVKRNAGVLFFAFALPLFGGCEFLTGVSEPDQLHVTVESDDVTSVVMIVSNYFLQIPDPECPEVCEPTVQMVVADTTIQSLPFQGSFDFTSRQQYFVEVYPVEETVATVAMLVKVDKATWFEDFRELQVLRESGGRDSFRFVYTFGRANQDGL